MSIKNDGHYFCRAGGNRPDGLNEPVTVYQIHCFFLFVLKIINARTQRK
ncbi:copper resistance protein [Salmonella enterica]|nr:copper resistance protein [Salmonella enterica]